MHGSLRCSQVAILLGFFLLAACGDDDATGSGTTTTTVGPGGSGSSGSGGGQGGAGQGGGGAGGGGCAGCTGEHLWSRRFGGPADQMANAGVDGSGNVLVACRFAAGFGFDGLELSPSNLQQGELDGCVAKLDASGNASWAHGFGASATGPGFWAPIADAAGNVYASTTFSGTIQLGDTAISSTQGLDAAIARYSAAGAAVWGKAFGAAGDQQIISMAPAAGSLLATGAFDGDLGPLTTAGAYDVWVGKFAETGEPTWLRSFGSTGFDSAYGVAPTLDGGVVFVGGFEGSVDFGGGPLVSAGSFDGFVAKLDASGNHVWSKRFGDADGFIQLSLAVDPSDGDIVIVLGTTQVVDFGGGPLAASGGYDVVVARLDAAGNHRWSRRFGDAADQSGTAVAAAGGYTLVAGDFEGSMDAGGGALQSAGSRDVFAAKLDHDGNHVWSKRFGDEASQTLGSVAVDGEGRVVLAGAFAGTIDLGGGPLASAGGLDIFVAELGP